MDLGKKTGGKHRRQHQTLKRYIRERDNYTCQLCGAEGWQVDHILPYAVSHDSTISNLRVLCHACNVKTRRKDTRPRIMIPTEQYESYLRKELAQYENLDAP